MPEKYPNLKTVAVVVLMTFGILAAAIIASMIALALAAIYAFVSGPGSGQAFMDAWISAVGTLWVSVPLMLVQNILFATLAVVFTLLIARGKPVLKELGLRPLKGSPRRFFAGMAITLLILGAVTAILVLTGMVSFEATGFERYGAGAVAVSLVAILVSTLFIAFGEEMAFRGLLQRYIVSRRGAATGLIASAVIFTLFHVLNDPRPIPIVGVFLSGLLLGGVFIVTGSLYTGIGLHFLWDFLLIEVLELGKPPVSMGASPVLLFSMPGDVIVAGVNLGRWDDGLTVVILSIAMAGLYVYWKRSRRGLGGAIPASGAGDPGAEAMQEAA